MNRRADRTAAADRRPTVVLAASLIDGTGGAPFPDPAVLIRDGRIAAVMNRDALQRYPASDAQVLDYGNATLAPGLIDGHVHLILSAADTTEQLLDDFYASNRDELALLAAQNARLCLAGGVTTVRDCGGTGTVVQSLRDMIDSGWLPGPRILSSGMPITTTSGHCHFFGLTADTADEVRAAVRRLIDDRVDFVKVMATGGRVTPGSDIFHQQYDTDTLRIIVEESHQRALRVAAHVLCTDGIAACVDAAIDTLEHCRFQDPSGDYRFPDDILDQMARQGTYVSLTMAGNMRDLMLEKRRSPSTFAPDMVARERFRTEAAMVQRGLNTFVTSDAGVTRGRFEEFWLSVACMTHLLGVSPADAVAHATGRAAKALGIEADVGTIEPGKIADLIVVDGDLATDIDALQHVRAVMRSGDVVARDGYVIAPGSVLVERKE